MENRFVKRLAPLSTPARGLVVGCGLACLSAFAVAEPEYAGARLGDGVTLTPALTVEQRFDDNIFSTETDEVDTPVTVLMPGATLSVEFDANSRLDFTYAGDIGTYWDSDDDNYDDHYLEAAGSAQVADRVGISGYVAYEVEHDDRGTGPSNGLADLTTTTFSEPTTYDRVLGGAQLNLGREGASRVRGELAIDLDSREYNNFRALTAERDRDRQMYRATGFLEIAPNTDLLVEGRYNNIEYDFVSAGSTTLDSEETSFLVGVTWRATARTTGTVKLGYIDKSFADAGRTDFDDPTWSIDVTYAPRTYSQITFSSGSAPRETDGQGDAITNTYYSANWTHDWSEVIHSRVGLNYTTEEFEGATREDDVTNIDLGVDYDLRRYLTIGVGYRFSQRNSNQANTDFDRNMLFVSASLGL